MKEFGRDLLMEGVKFLKGPKSYMKAVLNAYDT